MHPFSKDLVQEALGAIRSLPLSVIGALAIICVMTWMLQSSSSRRTGEKAKDANLLNSVETVGKLGNMDQAPARRRVRATFQKTQMSLDHILFRGIKGGVKSEEACEVNSRGMEIFTKNWLPEIGPVKALVFFCHGYGDTCTFFIEGLAHKLAGEGYGCFGMDYPGFGLSSGLHGYIPDFNKLVDDVIEHYSKIKAQVAFQGTPSFLFGQSMGGAVALKMHFKQPTAWNGAVLVAPMCKIGDNMYPPWHIFQFLKALAYVLPWAKLVPQRNLADLAFKDIKKRNQTVYNVACYKDRARLKTALELLKVTDDISRQLCQVSLPMLILHGARDVVTDPSVSRALYEQASSGDKTLHLYKDAWHAILEGEPDDVILQILDDIIFWLDAHSSTDGLASVQNASLQ
eukprot:c24712_g1_i1 orf=313-1515(+)